MKMTARKSAGILLALLGIATVVKIIAAHTADDKPMATINY